MPSGPSFPPAPWGNGEEFAGQTPLQSLTHQKGRLMLVDQPCWIIRLTDRHCQALQALVRYPRPGGSDRLWNSSRGCRSGRGDRHDEETGGEETRQQCLRTAVALLKQTRIWFKISIILVVVFVDRALLFRDQRRSHVRRFCERRRWAVRPYDADRDGRRTDRTKCFIKPTPSTSHAPAE